MFGRNKRNYARLPTGNAVFVGDSDDLEFPRVEGPIGDDMVQIMEFAMASDNELPSSVTGNEADISHAFEEFTLVANSMIANFFKTAETS